MQARESSQPEILPRSMVGVVVRDAGGIISDSTIGGPEGQASNAAPTDTSETVPASSSLMIAGCGVDAKEDAKVSKGYGLAGYWG
jgi:hypothetical protein